MLIEQTFAGPHRILSRKMVAAIALTLAYLGTMLVLFLDAPTEVFEPRLLLPILNTILAGALPIAVAIIAMRAYLLGGLNSILLMGCGLMTFGSGAILAGWLIGGPQGPNVNVTIYNVGALLGAVLHALGVVLVLRHETAETRQERKRAKLIGACAGIFILLAGITLAALQGATPLFFVQGTGPTLLRQSVLGVATTLYFLSALFLMKIFKREQRPFYYWYALSLLMICLGLVAALIQPSVGSPMGWLNRVGHYIAGLYAVAAIWATSSYAIKKGVPFSVEMAELFQHAQMSYEVLVETVTDPIVTTDQDFRIIQWNSAAERRFGYSKNEALRSSLLDLLITPSSSAIFRNSANEIVKASLDRPSVGSPIEMIGKTKDSGKVSLEVSLSGMRANGKQLFVSVFRDSTQRKAAEEAQRKQAVEALRDSEVRYRRLFESAKDGILILDAETGMIVDVNPFLIEMLGYSHEAFLQKRLWEVGFFNDIVANQANFAQLQAKEYIRYENKALETADGRRIEVEFVSNVYLVNDHKVIQCNIRDVTERKRAEQEIHDLNVSLERRVAERTRQLEEVSRAKSDFLANMSHELRTPLNAIIGFSEMLKDGLLGELEAKQRGFITDIFDAGTHLLSLINDILDLSRVEAGAMQLEPAAVDVAALLKASTQVVREKALVHHIRLDTQLDPTLGTQLLDQRKLKQIIYNLLANAVKFTPDGGAVTLRAHRCARAEVGFDAAMPARLIALPPGTGGEFLSITVEDSGVGIAEEHLPRLFEPFVQVDSSIGRRQGGTGLGLSLVRRFAELHGGTVGVASRPGVGSRFCVWLPFHAAEPVASADHENRSGFTGATTAASAVPLALVIEDDDRMADMIAAQLRAEGFEVMRAATAEEGLVRAAKHQPQLITLDIFLPAMDGWEFMRQLKANPRLVDTPVVIITVSADLDRGLALGARRVLHKPFRREELVATLAGLDARPNGTPARVLVVDDNVQAVELVATVLEAEGYRVLRAYGGAEAIEVARSARPDLVILDLMMPQVSGFEVARALRESQDTARIPILVLTAMDLSAEERTRLNGAVSAILAKASFSRDELIAELHRAIAVRPTD